VRSGFPLAPAATLRWWPVSWHPQDPRSWGGWAPGDPRWGRHQPTWGWGHPARPLLDNQLGYRLPSGGPPAAGQLAAGVALVLFALSPVTLFAWVVGQAVLRATGLRWWKLALACLAALAAGIAYQGGLGPALAHHFVGYLWFFRQFGAPQVDFPTVGAFLWPQLPLAVPVGLLTAALNQAGRPRQAIDPAEVRRTQRDAQRRMAAAVRRAGHVRDDHWQVPALGAQVDGDLGWTDKRGLVVVPPRMQARSRLIIGTSGMGKTVDAEREAFLAARAGRKFFVVDGKGTDPTFVERALAGYLWGHPHARVGIWPELPMDGWRGSPAAVHNRLLAMLSWTEPYYKDIASLLLRLALNAPGEDGPVRSSAQLLGGWTPRRWPTATSTSPTGSAKPEASAGGSRQGRCREPSAGWPTSSPPSAPALTPPRVATASRTSTSVTSAPPTSPAAKTPTRAAGCCWRTSPTTPPSESHGVARTPPSSLTSSPRSRAVGRRPSSWWSGCGMPAAPSTSRRRARMGWGMSGSRPGWSAPAPAGCCCTRCPTPTACWPRPG
jgi:hypothetical protein